MDRLSVRLSIVGAVLVLGSAAVVHSVLSKRQDESEVQSPDDPTVAGASVDTPPEPIPEDSSRSATLQPPPEFATSGDGSFDGTTSKQTPDRYGGIPNDPMQSAIAPTLPSRGFVGYGPGPNDGLVDQASSASTPTAATAGSPQYQNQPPYDPSFDAMAQNSTGSVMAPSSAYGAEVTANQYAANNPPSDPNAAPPGNSIAASLSDDDPYQVSTASPATNPSDAATQYDLTYGTAATDERTAMAPDDSAIQADATSPAGDQPLTNQPNTLATNAASAAFGATAAVGAMAVGQAADLATAESVGSGFRMPKAIGASDSVAAAEGTAATGTADTFERNTFQGTSSIASNTAAADPVNRPADLSPMSVSTAPYDGSSPYSGPPPYRGQPPYSGQSQESAGNSLATAGNTTSMATPNPAAATSVDPYAIPTSSQGTGIPTHMPASDVPGEQQLEGQQTTSLTLEKTAPEEIQVDREATFQILVRNTGTASAHNVVVVDQVPKGTEFVDARPAFSRTPDGMLIWQLGTIPAGGESILNVQVIPKEEREIGSVAYVSFQAKASVRSICTKPQLSVECVTSPTVLIGESITLDITVSNTGSGAAANVVLQEDVPEGFNFHAGRKLEQDLGTLKPGESVRLSLALDSAQKGIFQNKLTVLGDGRVHDQLTTDIQIIAPGLKISLNGPARRFLERKATYAIQVMNPGTASAKNVELAAYLPKGMKYVTSDNQGQYDPQSHAVFWSLDELPANKQGDAHVTLIPVEPGDQKLKVEGKADSGLRETFEHTILVEGLPELVFTVKDLADPIEVGSDTTYEIRILNQGSQEDTNIQVAATLPSELKVTDGEGPTQATIQGQQVVFAPLTRLGPKEEVVFKLHAHGDITGQHVIRVRLLSDGLRVPVTKEESTRVYADR